MLNVVSILIGILILLIVFSKVASADTFLPTSYIDTPCVIDCPDDMVKIYLGQFDVYCPLHTDKSIYPNFYHTAYVGECMDTVVNVLLMDKYSHFVKYAEYGNPKYKALVLRQLHKAIQYQLIE